MRVTVVAAVGRDGVIGALGDLPWRIPADLRRFKALTLGSTLVMGRRTFDSIGRPLPGRRTIVVTRQPDWHADGVSVAHSLTEALELAGVAEDVPEEVPEDAPDGGGEAVAERTADAAADVFVVGGGEIYALALPLADRLEITEVDQGPAGDTFFPPIASSTWVEVERQEHEGYAFVTYRRAATRAGRRPAAAQRSGG